MEQNGVLTVFARSPGWAARLRFALAELWPALRSAEPGLNELRVKVSSRPRGAAAP